MRFNPNTAIGCRPIQITLFFSCLLALSLVPQTANSQSVAALQESSSSLSSHGQEQTEPTQKESLILVSGAVGDEEYSADFLAASNAWLELANHRGWTWRHLSTPEQELTVRDQLESAIQSLGDSRRLWIVLIGHGTASAGTANFNLVGPDVSAKMLNQWLNGISAQTVVLNCSSASAPFLVDLSRDNRIVVTATRSASEINYSRFGRNLAEAISSSQADLDHDREVSLLEAFLFACNKTERFYSENSRLATEHALIDDNGDRSGTGSDFYRGIEQVKAAKDNKPIDGSLARRLILFSSPDALQLSSDQLALRDVLEGELDLLKKQKSILPDSLYLEQLEAIMLRMADLYDDSENERHIDH